MRRYASICSHKTLAVWLQATLGEKLLNAIGPGLTLRRVAFTALAKRSLELSQDGLLGVVKFDRRLDHDMTIQVAGIRAAHALDALSTQAESFSRLRAFRNRNLSLAAERRNLNLAP